MPVYCTSIYLTFLTYCSFSTEYPSTERVWRLIKKPEQAIQTKYSGLKKRFIMGVKKLTRKCFVFVPTTLYKTYSYENVCEHTHIHSVQVT